MPLLCQKMVYPLFVPAAIGKFSIKFIPFPDQSQSQDTPPEQLFLRRAPPLPFKEEAISPEIVSFAAPQQAKSQCQISAQMLVPNSSTSFGGSDG